MPKSTLDDPTSHPLFGEPLGDREKEIIRLAAWGLTNEEIGEILFLSPNTIKTYLRRSSHKTGLGNRTALAIWLLAQNIKAEAFDFDSTMYQLQRFGYAE